MGLDQYLYVTTNVPHTGTRTVRQLLGFIDEREHHIPRVVATTEAIYWRKAYEISTWFSCNCQHTASQYEWKVTHQHLEMLRNACRRGLIDRSFAYDTFGVSPYFQTDENWERIEQQLSYTADSLDALIIQFPVSFLTSFTYEECP